MGRAGAKEDEARKITDSIARRVTDGMRTEQIKNLDPAAADEYEYLMSRIPAD